MGPKFEPFSFQFDKRRFSMFIPIIGVGAIGGICMAAEPVQINNPTLNVVVLLVTNIFLLALLILPLLLKNWRNGTATADGLITGKKTYLWENLTAVTETPVLQLANQFYRDKTLLCFGDSVHDVLQWSVLPLSQGRMLVEKLKDSLREKLRTEYERNNGITFRYFALGQNGTHLFGAAMLVLCGCFLIFLAGFLIYEELSSAVPIYNWLLSLFTEVLGIGGGGVTLWVAYVLYRDQLRDIQVSNAGIGFGAKTEMIPWEKVQSVTLKHMRLRMAPLLLVRTKSGRTYRASVQCRNDWYLFELLTQVAGDKWSPKPPDTIAGNQRQERLLIAGGICLSAVFIMLTVFRFFGADGTGSKFALWLNGATAQGKIVKVGIAPFGQELQYEFSDATGREYRGREVSQLQTNIDGTAIVHYLPSNPEVNQLTEPILLLLTLYWWPGIAGLLFFLTLFHAYKLARYRQCELMTIIDEYDPFQFIGMVYSRGNRVDNA